MASLIEIPPHKGPDLIDITNTKHAQDFHAKKITGKDIKNSVALDLALSAPERVTGTALLGLGLGLFNPALGAITAWGSSLYQAGAAHARTLRKQTEGNARFHYDLLKKSVDYIKSSDFKRGFGDAATYGIIDEEYKNTIDPEKVKVPFIGNVPIKELAGNIIGTLSMDALMTAGLGGFAVGRGITNPLIKGMLRNSTMLGANSLNMGINQYVKERKEGKGFEDSLKGALITSGSDFTAGHLFMSLAPKIFKAASYHRNFAPVTTKLAPIGKAAGLDVGVEVGGWLATSSIAEKGLRSMSGLTPQESFDLEDSAIVGGSFALASALLRSPSFATKVLKERRLMKMTDEQLLKKAKIPKSNIKVDEDFKTSWFMEDPVWLGTGQYSSVKDMSKFEAALKETNLYFNKPAGFKGLVVELPKDQKQKAIANSIGLMIDKNIEPEIAVIETLRNIAHNTGELNFFNEVNYKEILEAISQWKK